MADLPNSPESSLLAILSSARHAGINKLTRTELIKYLYLVDVYVAEETSGTKWTDVEWQFLHFGPFSAAVASSLDSLVAKSFIIESTVSGTNRDGNLYSIPVWKALSEESFGFPRGATLKLQQAIRKFSGDLARLLNYVYFRTEPMSAARPGETLDFSMCRKFEITSVKAIPMKSINQSRVKELRAQRQIALAQKKEKLAKIVWSGAYDDEYHRAMSTSNEPLYEAGIKGKATISI